MNARLRDFEVHLERRPSLNAAQNARRRVAYVRAADAAAAKQVAESNYFNRAFRALSAREVRI